MLFLFSARSLHLQFHFCYFQYFAIYIFTQMFVILLICYFNLSQMLPISAPFCYFCFHPCVCYLLLLFTQMFAISAFLFLLKCLLFLLFCYFSHHPVACYFFFFSKSLLFSFFLTLFLFFSQKFAIFCYSSFHPNVC